MVFQSFNLFPHLTILENCTLAPIWVRKMPKAEAEELAMELPDPGAHPRAGEEIPGPAVRRSAAARRHRPRAVHASRRSCCSTSRPRRSIPEMIKEVLDVMIEPGRGRHDHGLRDARDGLRAAGRRPRGVHGPRRDRRERHAAAQVFENPQTDRLKLFLSQILRGH